MKLLKIFLLVALLLLVVMLVYNFKLVDYGIDQLKGQLHIVCNAKPVDEVLNDNLLTAEDKRKLLLIAEIKKFATDSLGLKPSNNYSTFYDQQNKPVLWVVTGCEPFALKAYEWKFPLLGAVSYKGFFVKDKAEAELNAVKQLGYDADMGTVSGWSTLGWFRDPVLSNFLKHSDGVLAETIIHELTHGTVYLKSNVDVNENLATLIGEKGAEQFLRIKYGDDAKQLTDYIHYKHDEEVYGNYLIVSAKRLDSLYATFKTKGVKIQQKYFLKYKLIAEILINIKTLSLYRKEFYVFNLGNRPFPNNTFFMSYLRYRDKQDEMRYMLNVEFKGNLSVFIKNLAEEKISFTHH